MVPYGSTGRPWTLEISQECLLCYDQSQQRSRHTIWPQNHKIINVLARSLVFSCVIITGFFSCNTITFQKYFWCSRFFLFDSNSGDNNKRTLAQDGQKVVMAIQEGFKFSFLSAIILGLWLLAA